MADALVSNPPESIIPAPRSSAAAAGSPPDAATGKDGKHKKHRQDQKTKKPGGREQIASEREYGGDKDHLIYKSGIPTLRSSAHRVKLKKKSRKHDPNPKDWEGKETGTTWLPKDLLAEDVFTYDQERYNLGGAVMQMLQDCDSEIVGDFERNPRTPGGVQGESGEDPGVVPAKRATRLEDFRVPVPSVWRKVNGGKCESSQKYLSNQVATDERFLKVFDEFVAEVALPYIKKRLLAAKASEQSVGRAAEELAGKDAPITFYFQRPPTLRLQPGPGWAKVKPHNDAQYGHQNGELNFWIPLTDRRWTGVDLWSETTPEKEDYHPIPAALGEVVSFHGSSCKHYVNANASNHTRVSLDFRVGVQGYFDPYWQMRGTTDDHGRKEVVL